MASTPRTISERVADAAGREFVGRRHELAILCGAVVDPHPAFLVAFIHGPGGIGKSRLLRMALSLLAEDARAILLDCREVEPTPDGFVRAMAAALGSTASDPDMATVVELVGASEGAHGARPGHLRALRAARHLAAADVPPRPAGLRADDRRRT